MIESVLLDGRGTGNRVRVNPEGTLSVVVHPHPPTSDASFPIPFRTDFTLDGVAGASSDMQVVGTSAAPITFSVAAHVTRETFVKTVSIEIADASATLNKFGNITALANGCKFIWSTQDNGEVEIAGSLQSNWDFVRLAAGNPAFGDGAAAFRAGNVSGTSEGYIPVLDMSAVFGFPYGLKLRKGTLDRLSFVIQDDTTGVDSFNAVASGLEIGEEDE
jgi:hypothetical protein